MLARALEALLRSAVALSSTDCTKGGGEGEGSCPLGESLGQALQTTDHLGNLLFCSSFSDFQNTYTHTQTLRKPQVGDVYQSEGLQEGSNESSECSEPAPSGLGQWLTNGQP